VLPFGAFLSGDALLSAPDRAALLQRYNTAAIHVGSSGGAGGELDGLARMEVLQAVERYKSGDMAALDSVGGGVSKGGRSPWAGLHWAL